MKELILRIHCNLFFSFGEIVCFLTKQLVRSNQLEFLSGLLSSTLSQQIKQKHLHRKQDGE